MLTIAPINQRTKSTINFKALPKNVKIDNKMIEGVSQQILLIPGIPGGGGGTIDQLRPGAPFFVFRYPCNHEDLPKEIAKGFTKAYTDVKKAVFQSAKRSYDGKALLITPSHNSRIHIIVGENDHIVTQKHAEFMLTEHEFDYTYLKNLIETDAIN